MAEETPTPEKRKPGRPKGTSGKPRVIHGIPLRNRLAEMGHDVDKMLLRCIINNQDDWKVMKELLPYLYKKMPIDQNVTTDGSIPMLVVTQKLDSDL